MVNIPLVTIVENSFVCSEKYRAFFMWQIGLTFKFNVQFQNLLKETGGKKLRSNL